MILTALAFLYFRLLTTATQKTPNLFNFYDMFSGWLHLYRYNESNKAKETILLI